MYDTLRTDPSFVGDLVRCNPGFSPTEITRAVQHVFHDEHLLGGGIYGEPFKGRFDPDPVNAEAWLRLRRGEASSTDEVMLRHEIVEAAYQQAHPSATYDEAHAVANQTADWESLVKGSN